jgi:OmpA-OmpF porin, OOP family
MRKAMVLGVLGLAGSLASPAFAEDQWRGIRLGLTLSQENLENDVVWNGYGDNFKANRLGYSFTGGWGLNKWLAFELSYNDGGEFSQDLETGDFTGMTCVVQHTDMRAFVGSVVGSWWFTDNFSVYGRAGIYYWKGQTTLSEDLDTTIDIPPPFRETFEDDGSDPIFGVGVQTQLDGALVRLEYQQVDTGDVTASNLDMFDNKFEALNLSVVWILR